MSEEKDNIDQVFNDAAHSQKAPQYHSSYWTEMNALLNARDAKRRALILWISGGTVVSLLLMATLFVINTDTLDTRVQYAQTNLDLETNKIISITEGSENNYRESTKSSVKNTAHTDVAVNQVQEHTSRALNQRDRVNTSSNQSGLTTRSSIAATPSKEERVFSNEEVSMDNELPIVVEVSVNNEVSTDRVSNTINLENADEEIFIDIESPVNNEASTHRVSNDINLEKTAEENISLPLREISLLTQNALGDLLDPKVKHTSKTQLSLYAKLGGGLMENYKTRNPYQSGLLDLSLNLEARFNSILFRTGIGTQYTTHADLIVSQRAKVYGFGVENRQNDLSYQDLLDIYIPIEFGYQLNSTSFGIGAQANYLLTTRMNLNTYQDQVLTNTEKYYGNKNGLRPFSTQGYVWIEQKIFTNFSVGLKIGTNISGRIKDGKYFNQSATINPIYGQLTFRLNIL